MLISPDKKLIFVRNEKTASTALQENLERNLRRQGFCRFIASRVRYTRTQLEMYKDVITERCIVCFVDNKKNVSSPTFRMHTNFARLRRFVHKDVFNSYLKVAVVRNPWDICVSYFFWYKHLKKISKDTSFDDYIKKQAYATSQQHRDINGIILADKILKYENLAEDVNDLFNCLKLESIVSLKKRKGVSRPPEARDYKEMYTSQETIDKVAKLFKRDINDFNYTF